MRIYTDGVYQAPHAADLLYPVRAGLIGLGLMAPLLSLGCAALAAARRPRHHAHLPLQCSLALCAAAIGWRCFPYWANGVFQAMIGAVPMADLDPKALLPALWLGNTWMAVTLLLYPLVAIGGLILVAAACLTARRHGWKLTVLTVSVVALTLTTFFVTPRYLWWLMD